VQDPFIRPAANLGIPMTDQFAMAGAVGQEVQILLPLQAGKGIEECARGGLERTRQTGDVGPFVSDTA